MAVLIQSLARAVGQLADPPVLRVLAKSILLTLAIFVVAGLAAWWALSSVIEDYAAGLGAEIGAIVATLLVVIGGWLLFRLVALLVIQLFADEIVQAVERRYYPLEAAGARKLSFGEDLANGSRGLVRALLANLVVLPFAIALLVTGIGTALLFWALNGWLLGRELQDMVWLRHRPAGKPGKATRPPVSATERFALGGIVAALLAVPFVNLFAPVIGAAAATHLVHQRRAREESRPNA